MHKKLKKGQKLVQAFLELQREKPGSRREAGYLSEDREFYFLLFA
jgi:hypothetical protein